MQHLRLLQQHLRLFIQQLQQQPQSRPVLSLRSGFGGNLGNDQLGSSSAESELGISEMTEAVSGLLLAELAPGRAAAEEARSLAPAPGTVARRTTELGPGPGRWRRAGHGRGGGPFTSPRTWSGTQI